jgi:CBS domain-containing protein
MKDWRKAVVSPVATIQTAIEILDWEAFQILFVVDEQQRLVGTVSRTCCRRTFLDL